MSKFHHWQLTAGLQVNKITSLYIHFPYCFHLCNYCDFYKRRIDEDPQSISKYEALLNEQFKVHESFLAQNDFALGELKSLYIGGGTPSLWAGQGASFFTQYLQRGNLKLEQDCEFTLEVDPNTFKEEELALWKQVGVNRVSIGAQAFSDEALKVLDRKHTKADVTETVEKCRKYFNNVSVDFILGIPYPEKRNLEAELSEILALGPDHMSVYMLNTRANYIHRSALPTDDTTASEYEKMVSLLSQAGLEQYEVSNFARNGLKSTHNLEYWKCHSVAAIGPSATGLLVNGLQALRYKWKVTSPEFQLEQLNQEQFLIEYVYMHLRSEVGLDMDALFQGREAKIEQLIGKWSSLGYLKNGPSCTKVQLTFNGYLMLDSIMGDLFSNDLL